LDGSCLLLLFHRYPAPVLAADRRRLAGDRQDLPFPDLRVAEQDVELRRVALDFGIARYLSADNKAMPAMALGRTVIGQQVLGNVIMTAGSFPSSKKRLLTDPRSRLVTEKLTGPSST
jgi:hypothetical protein